jgi:glycine/D-amino acid oxidase-like deaminating enzyme
VKPVVVVGTGIVGASIGYHLAAAGVPVTVVGRDAGATASSFGWIGAGGQWPGAAAALSGQVLGDWRRLSAQVPDLGVRWTGSLSWPVSGQSGTPANPAEITEREPHLRTIPEQAIYAPDDGGVDAGRAARVLLLAARERGARVLTGTVRQVSANRVRSTAGDIAASTIVLAAGAATAGLTRRAAADPAAGMPDRIGATSPALLIRVRAERAGLVRGIVATPTLEVREVRDRELLIAATLGHTWTWNSLREAGRRALRELDTAFGPGDRMLRGWRVGVRPMPTGGPVIGRLQPHLYAAVMHSGVCLAPTVGRLAAAEISTAP